MPGKFSRPAIAVLFAMGLLFTACSSGDSTADDANGSVATTAGAEGVAPADGATGDPSGSDGSDAAGAMDISALSDSDCLAIGNALTGVVSRGMTAGFADDLATFRSFAAAAPEATAAEIAVFLDAYEASHRLLDDAGVNPADPASMQEDGAQGAVVDAKAMVETAEVQAALAATEEFLFTTCPVLEG